MRPYSADDADGGVLEATSIEAAALRQDDRRGRCPISARLVCNRNSGGIVAADGRDERCGNKHHHHENR